MAAFHEGRPDQAERLAAGVLSSDPGHVAAAWILGQVLLAQGRAADALEPLERAARLNASPATETLLGRALADVGRGEAALEHLNRAVTLEPPFEMAFLELGDRLGKLGRGEEARRARRPAWPCVPGLPPVLRAALGYQLLACNQRPCRRAPCSPRFWPQVPSATTHGWRRQPLGPGRRVGRRGGPSIAGPWRRGRTTPWSRSSWPLPA